MPRLEIICLTRLTTFENIHDVINWFIPWAEKHFEFENKVVFNTHIQGGEIEFLTELDKYFSVKQKHEPIYHSVYPLTHPHTNERFAIIHKFKESKYDFRDATFSFTCNKTEMFHKTEALELEINTRSAKCYVRYVFFSLTPGRLKEIEDYLGVKIEPLIQN